VAAIVHVEGTELRAEVLAVTPVPIEVDGRAVRRPRALCRLRAAGDWTGVGWLELRGGTGGSLAAG
jgi:hypothetical protein